MAEDRILATARATDPVDEEDATKAELQRRMEQARATITQTVTEIKDTVTNQYQSVKETISDSLDWREQFRKRPVAWSVGALSVGFLTGYCIAATVKGDGGRDDYPSYEETDVWNVGVPLASSPSPSARSVSVQSSPASSFAAQAIASGAHGSTEYAPTAAPEANHAATGGERLQPILLEDEQPSGPSLFERFKETKAFDRLQDEVSKLGDRFIDQLSTVGQEVVLPALFAKLKDMFGVDLSDKKQGAGQSGHTQASASASTAATDATRTEQSKPVSDMGGLATDGGTRAQGGSV